MLIATASVGLAGCATSVFNPATNEPLSPATPPDMGAPTGLMHENSIVLSLSGGGLRAAAFAHGVLTALESVKTADGDLLDDVALISSASGSSLNSAHLAYLSVEELASPLRERIEAVPTRLTLQPEQVDATIQGAREATLALPRLRAYLRERVRPPR